MLNHRSCGNAYMTAAYMTTTLVARKATTTRRVALADDAWPPAAVAARSEDRCIMSPRNPRQAFAPPEISKRAEEIRALLRSETDLEPDVIDTLVLAWDVVRVIITHEALRGPRSNRPSLTGAVAAADEIAADDSGGLTQHEIFPARSAGSRTRPG